MSKELAKRSRALSYWLRHAPEQGGLTLDPAGWATVADVLAALAREGLATSEAVLHAVVEENDKRRFELSDDRSRIRARQGHSVEVEGSWEAAAPPAVLYHGTVERFLAAIMREGLTKQQRHHVHLSADFETAMKVGARRAEAVILTVAAGRMAADGHAFALSTNGVWLTDHVPPRYLACKDQS
ncbi:MAG: RNA 2'-phosphotransferase [Erythrobacter sp.]|uniref:RNA 2'-phosphotransferase n=1 Tax=Erythrobacter sp. TaxID=1042 RepID=UPI0025F6FB7A|nr:RNA 2'-phosphotransferase [Erythrobacter sp.]MCL9999993.1 RNA 2'-phosphotransferase [Erythrobacter sp.]